MLRIVFTLALVGIALFLGYKAASIYSLVQFADHMRKCLPASAVCRMADLKVPRREIEVAMAETLSCARTKQTAVEAVFLRIPKADSANAAASTDYKGLLEMCRDWSHN